MTLANASAPRNTSTARRVTTSRMRSRGDSAFAQSQSPFDQREPSKFVELLQRAPSNVVELQRAPSNVAELQRAPSQYALLQRAPSNVMLPLQRAPSQ